MTAADCAGKCAENPECVVSTWYATKKQCLALSDRGFRTYGPAKYWVTFVRTGKTTEEKGGNKQCSSEKLALEKELQERCEKEKVILRSKCDEDRASIDKKLQESKEEWEKKITALKTSCDADKSAKEQCEQDKAELNKKHNEEKYTKEKLEQEKQDILNKYKEEKAALEKANNDAKTKLEQENNKLKEVIATSGGGPAKPDSLPVGINPYLPCPNIDGKEYTVDGVTYRAFCWKKPRGRYINTDVDGGKLNIRDLVIGMKACSLDSACQGVYSDHQSYWTIHLDYQFPPLDEIPHLNGAEQHLSFIPVQPRGNNFKPNALAIPSLLAGNVFGGCPESDGQQLTIGSHTFNFHCREYTGAPDAQLPISSYIRYPPWCLAVCAGTPGCEGTSMGYGSCKFYSRFEKLEKMEQSKIVPHHWVAVLSQAGND
ncbi:hypothetical protein ANOM_008925 [Aspergillus nomiae NRRL 13137]|uniref:Uncharacterized protein n=1 Tax=Aspergillus nomiae NRRL (strain ATCC 15546 / NRRL 13137 / CBS 260.88 / M93) TaxID=1509407 RepID=A0A0L1IUR2_ASPN3|nr:uncharacterized protein ANOM_008925 [Aspergillus nomiae NRRL 13137]KNG83224.1 hypothetical protein ANOM_008925 [Aspergillus nomiae NRRL 13137]